MVYQLYNHCICLIIFILMDIYLLFLFKIIDGVINNIYLYNILNIIFNMHLCIFLILIMYKC